LPARVVAFTLILTFVLAFPDFAAADEGLATWYGPGFQGNVMSDGQIFDMNDPTTTACNIFPFGTWLRVTNTANGRSVVVQVRDRGAFQHAVDLSYAAFKEIADPALMWIDVTYQVVSGPSGAPVAPSPQPTAQPRAALSSRGSRPAPVSQPAATQYVIQPGDTLDAIGSAFGIDPSTLASWNGIADADSIVIGGTLRLTAPAAGSAAPPPASHLYVVQPGDTLYSLANQFGVTLDRLAAANGLSDPYPLTAGQSLAIPTADHQPSKQTYVVQSGDTLWAVATAFNVSVDSLTTANQIVDPTTIQPGTLLTIPRSSD
jgi:LysM repeat protein